MSKWKNALKRRLGRVPRRKVPKPAVNDILYQRALETSADFIQPHLSSALLIRTAFATQQPLIRIERDLG